MIDDFDDIPWQPDDTADEDWGVVSWQPGDSREPATPEELQQLCGELIAKLHFRARADVCFLFHKICNAAEECGPVTTGSIRAVLDWSVEDLNGYCDEVCAASNGQDVTS